MIIGLIGLGEMGSEIGRYLVMNDLEVISVYEGRSEISKKRASKYKIRDAGSIEQFCKISDLVISIIPPDKAVETANLYTSYKNKDGQIYCDLNAISTITAKKIKLLLDEKKIDYVDGAIMGGPPTENYSPRIYLSGKLSEKLNFLNGKGIELMVLKGSDFKASATKMVYASITKGSKALVAGALIAAKKNNV
ncbi:MAG: NAD(P)-binding domain-containing protein, partial [Chloroflexota bacterium]|nr:NAD(P)-binding domain-containing protein [Chloroflexota bacterium]